VATNPAARPAPSWCPRPARASPRPIGRRPQAPFDDPRPGGLRGPGVDERRGGSWDGSRRVALGPGTLCGGNGHDRSPAAHQKANSRCACACAGDPWLLADGVAVAARAGRLSRGRLRRRAPHRCLRVVAPRS